MTNVRTLAALSTLVLLTALGHADPGESEESSERGIVTAIDKAATLWKASCAQSSPNGCFTIREVARPNSCQAKESVLKRRGRNRQKAQRAMAQLRTALSTISREEQAVPGVAGAVAKARFLVAQAEFEALATIRSPRGLNFSQRNQTRRKKSEKRFLAYFSDATSKYAAVASAYQKVLTVSETAGSHSWRVRAAAGIARTYRLLASQLYSLEVPKDVRAGPYAEEATAAFCDAIGEKAKALADQSVEAASICVELEKDAPKSSLLAECEAMRTP